ncbi:alpha/beta hydrolase fold domain-containing protein [Streptomyces sp. NPDC055078]
MTTAPLNEAPPSGGPSGDPEPAMSPRTDPRTDPRLLAALTAHGLDAAAAPPPVDRHAAAASRTEFVAALHTAFEGLYEALPGELPGDDTVGIDCVTHTITGVDGNTITLRIYRPAGPDRALPCAVYFHGGGMTVLEADNKVHRRWCQDLAASGMLAIGVDFRNAYSPSGPHPFPAGLNDCAGAVAWIHANRDALGISRLVLQGESGGANLALATTLKAKREGRLDAIDGVYATVPYISGAYGWPEARKRAELPSLVENDGYFTTCATLDLLVASYDPLGEDAENPLCWPYFATEADLAGLPPHVIAVNELDPLRDEGIAFYRKLLRAGVPAVGRVNLGLVHGADLIFRQAVADVYLATVRDIKRFADSLGAG